MSGKGRRGYEREGEVMSGRRSNEREGEVMSRKAR